MSNKPGAITIIQLTRFGDILQTIWAVKDLKSTNPDVSLNLITRERFGKPLEFLLNQVFQNVIYLDSSAFSCEEPLEAFDKIVKEANSWNSNVIVNLSFCNSSAYLNTLLEAKFKLGLVANEFGAVAPIGAWSEYVYSTVMRGALNPYSLVDIFGFILGTSQTPTIPERRMEGNLIAIHPFASQTKKFWSESKWVEIIRKILKDNSSVNLMILGASNDLSSAKKIKNNPLLKNYGDRIILECGSLNLEELFERLEECFLFCGHDSMVGHMASLAGVQTLTVSLGTVRPSETTPYGLHNFSLSPRTSCYPCFPTDACDDFKCHKDLSYQLVSEVIQQLIDSHDVNYEEIKKNVSPMHLSTVDIHKTNYSKVGLFKLDNIAESEKSFSSTIMSLYRIVWLFMLEGTEEISAYPKLNKLTEQQLQLLIPNIKQLSDLANFGKKYSRFILEEVSKEQPDVEYIKSCGKKIEEIDEMQNLISEASPVLNPIVDFYNLKKSKMLGSNLVELCSSSYEIYQSLGSFCEIFQELAEKTINEFKISNKSVSMKEAKE